MYFFRFFLLSFLFVLTVYYAMVLLHMIGTISITEEPLTWKAAIPFYHFFK